MQYYLNKAKLREEGLEARFAAMNRAGLGLAKEVAVETGTLAAGSLYNSIDFDAKDPRSVAGVREMFRVHPPSPTLPYETTGRWCRSKWSTRWRRGWT